MIEFKKVSKRYPNGQEALRDINFSCAKGEMYFLTGHSGAGKSTLLQIIALIERVSQGQVLVNGTSYRELADQQIPYIRRHIGMIFQNPKLLPDRSVYENVALPLHIRGMRYQEIGKRVRAALDKVGLLTKGHCFPKHLSCGEQQRVGIARAVVHKPQLLLADEPTGNLDPDLSKDIMNLFIEFNRVGVTQLIATHDINLILPFNLPILSLENGQLQ